LQENRNFNYTDHRIPDNFKRVVVNFISDSDTRFCGITFYDKQGKELLSLGYIKHNPVETIVEDDERIVGIASRNEKDAWHDDF